MPGVNKLQGFCIYLSRPALLTLTSNRNLKHGTY